MFRAFSPGRRTRPAQVARSRRGIIAVLTALLLVVLFGFVALAVDTGKIVMTQTEMQNAVDAAALAASQEIVASVQEAGVQGGNAGDANSIAIGAARTMAANVAEANGVYVDPATGVRFGKRTLNEQTGEWSTVWNTPPYNVVQVTASRDNPDPKADNAQLPLNFGWAVGKDSVELSASATAFVEARDLVVVLDFSGSMNDDSEFQSISRLGRDAVEANMLEIKNALGHNLGGLPWNPAYLKIKGMEPVTTTTTTTTGKGKNKKTTTTTTTTGAQIYVTFEGTEAFVESSEAITKVVLEFTNGNRQTINTSGTSGTYKGSGSNNGKTIAKVWVKSDTNMTNDGLNYGERFIDDNAAVKTAFGLNNVAFPYSSGSWDTFLNYCRNDSQVNSAGYRNMYGGKNWVNYLLADRESSSAAPDLYKAPAYPFHAIKNGTSLFLDFLANLDFGDEVGLVSYDETSRVEYLLDESDAQVDLSADMISPDYTGLDTIQRHKQAGHYAAYTGMGYGIKEGRLLLKNHSRTGSRPTMLVMTDGQANRYPSNWSLPSGWKWSDLTDYNGDGTADYTTSDKAKQYAFYEAKQAIDAGYTIHTMSVGAGADRDLMKAMAFAGQGIWIDVPGGATVAEMEEQMLAAFSQIAAKVPPPKLVYSDGE